MNTNLTRVDHARSIQKPTSKPRPEPTQVTQGKVEFVNRIQSIDRIEYTDSTQTNKLLKSQTIILILILFSIMGLIGQIQSVWGN